MPAGRMPRRGDERIHIEIVLAVQRQARQHAVVERGLHPIGVARLTRAGEQAPVPHHPRHRRARLGIGAAVGEFEGGAERLAGVVRTQAAGDIGLGRIGAVPQAPGRVPQVAVLEFQAGVGQPAGEINRPHRVPRDIPLLHRRLVVLEMAIATQARRLLPALVQEEAGPLGVGALAGFTRQLDQRQLDLGMPVCRFAGVGPELGADVIGQPHRHVQQRLRPGCAVVGNARLDQVPRAVQLMHVDEVGVALARPFEGEIGVQVAVWLLRGGNVVHETVHQRPQRPILRGPPATSWRPPAICRRRTRRSSGPETARRCGPRPAGCCPDGPSPHTARAASAT